MPVRVYAIDIAGLAIGSDVELIGHVHKIRNYKDNSFILLRDLSGQVGLNAVEGKINQKLELRKVKLGNRIRVSGSVAMGSDGHRYVEVLTRVEVLGSIDTNLSELDTDLKMQASRMVIPRIKSAIVSVLVKEEFLEIETRLIATDWPKQGLEPMRVQFPGFGASVTLAVSPMPQLLGFMGTTGAPKVFAISKAFATTFRDRFSDTESSIIGIRQLDSDKTTTTLLMRKILIAIAEARGGPALVATARAIDGDVETDVENGAATFVYSAERVDIDSSDEFPQRSVVEVYRIATADGRVLMEGALEQIDACRTIAGVIVYVEQFLPLFDTLSVRRLGGFVPTASQQGAR